VVYFGKYVLYRGKGDHADGEEEQDHNLLVGTAIGGRAKHGLDQRIKYARLIRRKASCARAQGADSQGSQYFVQLALEGVPYRKPKHTVGTEVVGLDLGPSTIAIVPRAGEARLELLCAELQPDAQASRRLQRQMERQRRAANPGNYDAQGRPKKRGTHGLLWHHSRGYEQTRRRKTAKERRLCAHLPKSSSIPKREPILSPSTRTIGSVEE
jgi:hypothetical protein